jgi:putative colanic acid biosynthesis acetyltransferase WcaF
MNKVDFSVYDNSWYNPGGSSLKRVLWYFVNVLFFMNPLNPISSVKVKLLRCFGAKIGKGVVIKPSVNIKYPWNLSIGDYTWIGENVWIDNLVQVTIGSDVCVSQGAMLLCGNHNYKKSTFDLMVGKIVLEDGCWVGAQSVVCPGVTLHSHAVLGVASVANKNLDAYTIYQGNPAHMVRKRIIVG